MPGVTAYTAVSSSMRAAMPRARSHSSSLGTSSTAAGAFGLEMTPTVLMMGIEEKLLVPFGLEMTPTVLMMGIEEKLLVPFGAQNGAGHDSGLESEFPHGLGDAFAGSLVELRLPNDGALAHLALADLELRFDQY